ncbi:MAG: signal peptidase I [Eubacteriales bacterium]|nr:signal peptidase I [Eubacteriales bacterium]
MAVLGLALLIPHVLIQRTRVHGDSMLPTMQEGDTLLIDKLTYRFRRPKRFEIVVFPYQYRENTYYIKRIIGLPGETIRIEDGVIYINGSALQEHFGNARIREAGLAGKEMTLGRDEYFVLGDNRNFSLDSREPSVGNVKAKEIVGRAAFCLFPLERFGVLK